MEIVRANFEDAPTLTEIALAAKRNWGYPEKWMEDWREALTITPASMERDETWLAIQDGQPTGFYSLHLENRKLHLVHLWILPSSMGQGIGRSLFTHATVRGQELGFREIEIESDPNAEGFYLRMGASRIGLQIRETQGHRRELPVLIYQMNAPR